MSEEKEIEVEDDDVNLDKPRMDTDDKSSDGSILTEEQFNALPDDVGDPPGTMLTPSGKTRDERNEWFEKYGNTHSTS